MKRSEFSGPAWIFIFAFSSALLITVSCERKVDTIKNNEVLTLPSLTVKNFETVVDDSGKVQLIMSAPIMETYNNFDSPYSDFKSGIHVIFFDGKKEPVATVSAKYARYTNKKSLWELRDSVVVVNGTNDKLETEQLFWDQGKDLIYNEMFVKLSNEDQTITGNGFESDIRLTKRRIKKVSGPIYLRDE
jgi:LPS export ABC transporter protein LptC